MQWMEMLRNKGFAFGETIINRFLDFDRNDILGIVWLK